ncbi:MAG: hypothetical protein MUQ27_00545 [Acidimicrobiia bacterium]|nr:hypothetical protein [Acidimicrobiia bacterium]
MHRGFAIRHALPVLACPFTRDLVNSGDRTFEHADLGPPDGLGIVGLDIEDSGECEPDLVAIQPKMGVELSVVIEYLDRTPIGPGEDDRERIAFISLCDFRGSLQRFGEFL